VDCGALPAGRRYYTSNTATMNNRFDVIVVGVGAMGSPACYDLARQGIRVLGLEQHQIGHGLGSSGGQTRLIRMAYYEHPHYVPLLRRAYELWNELETESKARVLHRTGGIYMGPQDGNVVGGSLRSARLHGLGHELLSHDDLARRYPQFAVPEDHVGLFEPAAGFLMSELAIQLHAQLARQCGAVICEGKRVTSWSAAGSGVTVRTDREEFHAGQLIFTAGAWTDKLVGDLGVDLKVTRQVLGWVVPTRPTLFEIGACPCWAIEQNHEGAAGLFYGFPVLEGEQAMKVAFHHPGPRADPDALDRSPAPADELDFRPRLARLVPAGDGALRRIHICMYTYSPDGHFILDRHPAHPNVLLACGFSGHGYKFAPVIGHALAEMIVAGRSSLPVEFLRLDRFGLTGSNGGD
jgi:sarcosine oxidase